MTNVVKTITIRGESVGVEKLLETTRALGVQVEETTSSVNGMGAGLSRLVGSLDPAFRATQQFERSQGMLQRALDTGRISTARHAELLELSRQRMVAATAAAQASAAGFNAQAAAARASGAAMNAMGGQTGNLAAQLQDIAISAQMGMNPLMIALQQGTQISAVLGPMGARGAVSALGAAFASLVSPVSLATIAIVGLGTYGVSALSELLTANEDVGRSLDEQAALIQTVAQRWGDAAPALREYADQVRALNEAAENQSGIQTEVNNIYAQTRAELPGLSAAFAEVASQMLDMGGRAADVKTLQAAIDDLTAKTQSGTATAAEMGASVDALASALTGAGVPAASAMMATLDRLSAAFLTAASNADRLQVAGALALARGGVAISNVTGGRGADPRSFEKDDYWEGRYFPKPARVEVERPVRSSGGGMRAPRAAANDDIQREREAVKSLIEQMTHERDMIGLTALERDKANALRRAGKAATDDERAAIVQLVEQTHLAREADKQLAEQKKALGEAQEWGFNLAGDALTALVVNGEKAEDVFKKLAVQIALAVAQGALLRQGPLAGLFGGGGGLGALLGLGGGIPGFGGPLLGGAFPAAPSFDGGGFTGSGSRSGGIDGKGGFPAILHPNETVIDHSRGQRMGGINVTIGGATINVSGSADAQTLAEIRREIAASERRTQAAIIPAIQDAQRRRIA